MRAIFISAMLLVSPLSRAQSHPFFDKANVGGIAVLAASISADGFTTRRVVTGGGRELNPIAAPFAHSDRGQATICAIEFAAVVGTQYVLHRRGWHNAEHILPWAIGGVHGTLAWHNGIVLREK
jgi:hypothetical protein